MIFIKNGTDYPRYIGDIQLENPTWEPGQALPSGWESVQESIQPEISPGTTAREVLPILINGIWVQTWEAVTLSELDIEGLISGTDEVAKKFLPTSMQP